MHLLIGRINGKSATRRQRRFKDQDAIDRAIARWTTEGFNVFWHYGPGSDNEVARPLIRQWNLPRT